MKYEEIKEVIKSLSYSQGFYGRQLRFLEEIEKNEEQFEEVKRVLEEQNFKEPLDIVMWFES